MKITKISQWGKPVPQPQVGTTKGTQQKPQQASQETQDFSKALSLNPKVAKDIKQALVGSGLSKQKIMPFLDQLFTALGDVPLSQIKNLINSLVEEQ